MPTYTVEYSLLASGSIEVDAQTKEEAEQLVYEMSMEQLIADASFDDSLEILEVTKE
jgi:hypothetical protein